ncbi:hypothetical protein [Salibacterium qingdaonense]|uniref:Uncharacterized protein n=1 Tax=Salibacterium qingdaonense TaxID=266892 RepID=A0A1I4Q5Y6_9BACI|nr:hypothetical protein [Salibacterium qingdaonense]SFM35226.1 hypothetical protein SAMN04488054_1377 [Salibacterium qingdaonense]
MKCYYCEKECEGLAFEQGDFTVFAHKECVIQKVEKDGRLTKGLEAKHELS